MKTHKSIYETPLVHEEAFSTEVGFAASYGDEGAAGKVVEEDTYGDF